VVADVEEGQVGRGVRDGAACVVLDCEDEGREPEEGEDPWDGPGVATVLPGGGENHHGEPDERVDGGLAAMSV
jgi:hypothetical protein